jgi:hypothetical protein
MLKRWYEAKPFTFGSVFIFFYMTIPIVDAMFIVPYTKPHCNESITDQKDRSCSDWIHTKEKGHVRTTQRGYGRLPGNTSSNEYMRDQEREITDFGRTQNKSR